MICQILNRWYAYLNIEERSYTKLLWSYYLAAASIFEPERWNERVAWAKTVITLDAITSFFARPELSNAVKQAFVDEFTNPQHHHKDEKPWHAVMNVLHETINQISSDALVTHGVNILPLLHSAVSSPRQFSLFRPV